MKHYIVVSLDIKYKNAIIIGFSTEKRANNAIEKLNFYGYEYYGCTWFSIDNYGFCEEQEIISYYSNKNIIQFMERTTPLTNKAITAIGKALWRAYNESNESDR